MTDLMTPSVPSRQAPGAGAPLATEAEAREVAEAARETEWTEPSFVRELFEGDFRFNLVHPYPEPDPADLARAAPFMAELEAFLRDHVDSDRIDREGQIPPEVVEGLRAMGAFGIKIPREYGGLGLSQISYTRAIALVTSIDGSLTALLSASQSIGVPVPLKLFGTEEQKQKYFPRLAKGAISAFALTETNVGSDPAGGGTPPVGSPGGPPNKHKRPNRWCTKVTRARQVGGIGPNRPNGKPA
jgi:hypothetical protein